MEVSEERRLHDFGNDPADAAAREADSLGSTLGQVEHAAANEGAAIVDGDDDAAAAVGDPQTRTERQAAMSCSHCVLIEALARCGAAAGFVAVKGSYAGKASAAGGTDRCIGVQPGIMGVMPMMVVVIVMVAVMPGFR